MNQVQTSWDRQTVDIAAQNNPKIITVFKYLYFLIILYLVIGTYSVVSKNSLHLFFQASGVIFGRLALVLLGIVILPGILGRFGIEIKLTRLITLFRRQLGITVFLLAFTHYHFVRGLLRLTGKLPILPPFPLFEMIGYLALIILFLMFLTSNNFAVRRLKKWWKRLHRLVYVAIWLLVLHTALQRISVWSFLIGTMAILETASLIYFYILKPKSA